MTVTTIDAEWSSSVNAAFGKYSVGDTEICGALFGNVNRMAMRFPLAGIPSGDVASLVELLLVIDAANNVAADSWLPGPYNGTGVASDPETDSAGDMIARCDTTSDNYGSTTAYRTNGLQTVTLGAAAIADVQAAFGVSDFSLALKQVDESTGTNHNLEIAAYTDAADGPQLRITHSTPATGAGSVPQSRKGRQLRQLLAG